MTMKYVIASVILTNIATPNSALAQSFEETVNFAFNGNKQWESVVYGPGYNQKLFNNVLSNYNQTNCTVNLDYGMNDYGEDGFKPPQLPFLTATGNLVPSYHGTVYLKNINRAEVKEARSGDTLIGYTVSLDGNGQTIFDGTVRQIPMDLTTMGDVMKNMEKGIADYQEEDYSCNSDCKIVIFSPDMQRSQAAWDYLLKQYCGAAPSAF